MKKRWENEGRDGKMKKQDGRTQRERENEERPESMSEIDRVRPTTKRELPASKQRQSDTDIETET